MTERALNVILIIAALLLVDLYVLHGLRGAFKKWKFLGRKSFTILYWLINAILIIGLITGAFVRLAGLGLRAAGLLSFSLIFIGKLASLPFLIIDDLRRIMVWREGRKTKQAHAHTTLTPPDAIPRSEFLMKAGLLAGSIPLAGIAIDMPKGLYDYHVRYQTLYLPNLPRVFDGLKLGQISDIHSGSFYNKKAVLGGVEMLLNEKPDLIFFTGDLVNGSAAEMRDYQDIFAKVKAPLGVFSSLGNHDYGDYGDWPNP
ncbi:MAG TPA: metallophosphoesterase, partial [Mucilaginibacter sp.]